MRPVQIHTGQRCGEASAFTGEDGPRDVVVGDRVEFVGHGPLGDCQFAMEEGGFVLIRDHRFAGWSVAAAPDLVCYTFRGSLAGVGDIAHASHGRTEWQVGHLLADYEAELYPTSYPAGHLDKLLAEKRAWLTGVPHRCRMCRTVGEA